MKYYAGVIFAIGSLLAGLLSYLRAGSVPSEVPMHWDINMHVDRYGSRMEALLFVPIMLAVFCGVFSFIGVISSSRLKFNTVKALNIFSAAIVVFFLLIHNSMLLQNPDALPGIFPFLFPSLLLVLGFAMNGVEPNPWVGIRVPWTMSNPMVWRISHERASKLWVYGGAIGLILAILKMPIFVPILIFVGCLLYPLFDSYRISKSV